MITQTIKSSGFTGRKSLFRTLLGGFAALTGYGFFYEYNKYQTSQNRWNSIETNLKQQQTPVELKDYDAKIYPWARDNKLKDWEYKLVKLTGYFKEERFFVRRQRAGKEGYLVFAPFITAFETYDHDVENVGNPNAEYAVFVNLGWVPLENKDDIEMGSEPIPALQAEDGKLYTKNPITGFNQDPSNPIEEEQFTLCEVTGIVRRGEQSDILNRRRNWPEEGVFTYIDLPYMSRQFRLYNKDIAGTAYIERIVQSYESEEEEQLYPVPATKENFDRSLLNPNRHRDFSYFLLTTSGLSVLTLLSLLKK